MTEITVRNDNTVPVVISRDDNLGKNFGTVADRSPPGTRLKFEVQLPVWSKLQRAPCLYLSRHKARYSFDKASSGYISFDSSLTLASLKLEEVRSSNLLPSKQTKGAISEWRSSRMEHNYLSVIRLGDGTSDCLSVMGLAHSLRDTMKWAVTRGFGTGSFSSGYGRPPLGETTLGAPGDCSSALEVVNSDLLLIASGGPKLVNVSRKLENVKNPNITTGIIPTLFLYFRMSYKNSLANL